MFPTHTIAAILRETPTLTYREACGVAAKRGNIKRAWRKKWEEKQKARPSYKTRFWWEKD